MFAFDLGQVAGHVFLDHDAVEQFLVADQADRLLDHVVDVQSFLDRRPFPGEIQQAANDVGRAARFVDDQVQVLAVLVVHVRLFLEQVGEGEHAGQRVVDLVGHAGGQAAQRRQLLAASDLLPGERLEPPFALGHGVGHLVDGPAEHPDFARRPDSHPGRQVALDHVAGHGDHPAHGPEHDLHGGEGQHQAGHAGRGHGQQHHDQHQEGVGHEDRADDPHGQLEPNGHLSREAVFQIGRHLALPTSKIFGVATFYNQFRFQPQGRFHVQVCRGTACHVKGSLAILEAIKRDLKIEPGQTSRDALFSLEVVACIGACGLAPVICVNGEFHAGVTTKKVCKILDSYRRKARDDDGRKTV